MYNQTIVYIFVNNFIVYITVKLLLTYNYCFVSTLTGVTVSTG